MQNTDPLYITRFVAAMSIVVHHFLPARLRLEGLESLIHNFSEGVNYFYFLSGFVMVIAYRKYIYGAHPKLPRLKYWIKRFARIYPVYLLALLIILAYHFFVEASFTSLWERLPFELAMIQQWVGFGSINSPAWSVSCEVFFYIAFPFFILKLAPLQGKQLAYAALKVFGIILVVTFFGYYADSYNRQHTSVYSGILHGVIHYHPFLRIIVFVAGCLGGIWFVKNGEFMKKIRPYSFYLLLGTMLAVLVAMIVVPVRLNVWLNYGLLTPLYFLFVIAICNQSGWLQKAMSSKVCIFLGDISYGVYILQVPVQMFFAEYIVSTNNPYGFLIYCVVLIIVSAVSYILIEKPLRKEIADALILRFVNKPSVKVHAVKQP